MKNKIIAVLLAFSFLLNFTKPYKTRAYADAGLLSMMSALAYAYATSIGFDLSMTGATEIFSSNWMDNRINDYANSSGQSVAQIFGSEALRLEAGKLVAGQQAINGVINFLGWLKDTYSINNVKSLLGYDDTMKPTMQESGKVGFNWAYGVSAWLTEKEENWGGPIVTVYRKYYQGYQGNEINESAGNSRDRGAFTGITMTPVSGNKVTVTWNFANGSSDWKTLDSAPHTVSIYGQLSDNYLEPQPIPQDKEWQGDFSGTPGFAEPPVDLPDFLSRIPVAVAENNLDVVGDITDTGGTPPTPTPNPTPSPSPAPYPGLSIADKIALILGEITAIMFDTKGDTAEQTYQDIGEEIEQTTQDIAESMTQPITQTQTQTQQQIMDSTQTITDTITQTQTQTQQQIMDSTQTITDTITQTQTQTQEKLEDITQTIEDVTSVPDQTSWDKVKKDLHGVFPFCIPWDIYGMLNAFNAEPRAPYFEYPFKIPSINLDYTLELDFKDFDPVAQTLRTVELIAFCVGLAILTSKVIRW